MQRWSVGVILLCVGLLPLPALAQEPGEDLLSWVASACARPLDPLAMGRLDQVAGKAMTEWLRKGRYRDTFALAKTYWDCINTPKLLPVAEPGKVRAVSQVICFVPLAMIEAEGKVDEAVANDALARCLAPPTEAPKEEDNKRRWAEDVRRYVHLVAAGRPPREVLVVAQRYMKALEVAGFSFSDEAQSAREDDYPDPVFALRVLALGAAIGSGDLETLLGMAGGEACASPFLAALGVIQSVPYVANGALPLVLRACLQRASLDTLVAVTGEARKRFDGRQCAVPVFVSAFAVSGLTAAVVDDAVASGRVADIAALAMEAPGTGALPGAPMSRAAVLKVMAAKEDPRRGQRLCELGDAYMEASQVSEALSAYSDAAKALAGGDAECALVGQVEAIVAEPKLDRDRLLRACKELLTASKVSSDTITRILRRVKDSTRRAILIGVLWEAKGPNASEALREALIREIDQEPGSPSAAAAMELLPQDGGMKDPEGRILFGLIAGRHHVVMGNMPAAQRCFSMAFKMARTDMEGVSGGVAMLLKWLATRKHYGVLDKVVQDARKARLLDVRTIAEVAAIIGEVGERTRAKRLLETARAMNPKSEEEWLAIANAFARIDLPGPALAALVKSGKESQWDAARWMTKGRIEMARKHYRDAAWAYGKAAELDRDDSTPLFFRGLVRLLLGDPEGAEQDFRSCMAMGDGSAQVLGGLGYALFDQSRFEEAEKAFRKALERDKKGADNHLGLALTLLRRGDEKGAVAAFNEAVKQEPAMGLGPKAAEQKGYVYSDVEKAAWEDLSKVVRGR